MLKVFGFRLELKDSNIPGGGRGVFLSGDSCTVPPGQLVALYPGEVLDMLLYLTLTLFLASVHLHQILRYLVTTVPTAGMNIPPACICVFMV